MEHFDICIVGAGPAGTIAAIELYKLGYKVLVLEKNTFPRFHIGCSLSPAIVHWLETLKLDHLLEPATIKQNYLTTVLWESTHLISKNDKNITIDRGVFDQNLASYAAHLGVDVIQSSEVVQAFENKDTTWNIQVRAENKYRQIQVRFIVEASGRKSIIKTGKISYLPTLSATYGFLPLTFQHSFIEAGEYGWYWATPYKHQCLIAFFSHPSFVQKQATPSEYYTASLKKIRSVCIDLPHMIQAYTCNASSHYDKCPVTENYIKIGDAAYTTDPISSQGVIKAIKNAVHATKVIHTILHKPEEKTLALSYYKELIQRDIGNHKEWMYNFYSSQTIFDSIFWQQYKKNNSSSTTIKSDIQLNTDDYLYINPNLHFAEIPVLGQHYIEKKTGVYFHPSDEPFVFVENITVATLLKQVHKCRVSETVNFLYKKYPSLNPINLLGYLLKHRLLVSQKHLSN